MLNLKRFASYLRRASVLIGTAAFATAFFVAQPAFAGTATIIDVEQGATPFMAYAGALYYGTNIANVSYSIVPKSGSVTRPFGASYSASYLSSHNFFIPNGNAVIIPVFGLYAGSANTVNVSYTFTDGTVNTQQFTITTPTYTDPCAEINQRSYLSLRGATSSLSFDYFELKDSCSTNGPAIVDTDGNLRWVGDAGSASNATALFNNAFFFSDGATGIKRMDLTTGNVTKLGDYASIGVTFTGHHNIDPGRDGIIVDVNTKTETEAVDLEINPTTGAVLQQWDLGAIISATMQAGGDNPSGFVLGTSADWFHNNAVAYNPADNTLIVSSRENFVIAVDYDAPATGQRKIHWILGDTTKAWHQYPTLAALSLKLSSGTLPPIGQHGVSIDHLGNLLLFDDGLGSLTLTPAGASRNYSAARAYQINTSTMTATSTYNYTASNNGQPLFSPICGSVYDVGGNYLVDFATANSAAVTAVNQGLAPGPVTALLTNNGTSSVFVAADSSSQIKFVMNIPTPTPCGGGWNAVPLPTNTFIFN